METSKFKFKPETPFIFDGETLRILVRWYRITRDELAEILSVTSSAIQHYYFAKNVSLKIRKALKTLQPSVDFYSDKEVEKEFKKIPLDFIERLQIEDTRRHYMIGVERISDYSRKKLSSDSPVANIRESLFFEKNGKIRTP